MSSCQGIQNFNEIVWRFNLQATRETLHTSLKTVVKETLSSSGFRYDFHLSEITTMVSCGVDWFSKNWQTILEVCL